MDWDSDLTKNPLIKDTKLPFGAPSFAQIKPKHFIPAIIWSLNLAKENIDSIIKNTEAPTFTNTVHSLAVATEDFDRIHNIFRHYEHSNETKEIVEIRNEIDLLLNNHNKLYQSNHKLYNKIRCVQDNNSKNLTPEQETVLNIYSSYLYCTTASDSDKETEIQQLQKELDLLSSKYRENIKNDKNASYIYIPANEKYRIKGLPQRFKDFTKQNAIDRKYKNGYVIPINISNEGYLSYINDRKLRKQIKDIADNIGLNNNIAIAHKILIARHKLAKLKGFSNYAESIISPNNRMVANNQVALSFITNHANKHILDAKKTYNELKEFAFNRDGVKLEKHDLDYYEQQMKEELAGNEAKTTEEYFELENLLEEINKHCQKRFGVFIIEAKNKYETSEPDIRSFEAIDINTGEVKSIIFLDLFTRENKKTGNWMQDTRNAGLYKDKHEIPIASAYMNLKQPSKNEPTLVPYDGVKSLFHEFGHLMHESLYTGDYKLVAGTCTFTDYVELPAFINQGYTHTRDFLQKCTKHYKTGKPMPKNMIDSLLASESKFKSYNEIQFLIYPMIDLVIHSTDPENITDLQEFEKQLTQDYNLGYEYRTMFAANQHIFADRYATGMYAYPLCRAMAEKINDTFEEKGHYDPELCQALKTHIFETGGSEHPAALLEKLATALNGNKNITKITSVFSLTAKEEGCTPSTSSPAYNIS